MKALSTLAAVVSCVFTLFMTGCSSAPAMDASATETSESATMKEQGQPEWAREVPRKALSTPYTMSEKAEWIKNVLFGPSTKHKELSQFVPQTTTLNHITPKLTLGFFGDVMQMKDRELRFGDELKLFFKEADYLVGNFEGVISSAEGVLMASTHSEKVLLALKNLYPPEKTVLTNANNHSCDFGWAEFENSYQMQKDHGFLVIGRKDQPSIVLNGEVNIANVTQWVNQPCNHVAKFEDIDAAYNKDVAFNILSPHWGYEQQLYPNPEQIQKGQGLLEQWDMIVGHHSHCPQVVSAYETKAAKKLVAYSLGDFCTHLKIKKFAYGIVVRAQVGPDAKGTWKVGKVDWRCTKVNHIDDRTTMIDVVGECGFFDIPQQ